MRLCLEDALPRRPCCKRVEEMPGVNYFKPRAVPLSVLEEVTLSVEELEALRLAHLEGLYQQDAAERMAVSRATFGRVLDAAHRKVTKALVEGCALQPLLAARFAPGTRWRLSAWVKGEAIQRGDAPWKVGVLRFSVAGGPNKYVGSSPLLGTFPWRQVSVDLTIPAAIEGLGVEIGLNGATGKMWIDDVELKPLN